MDSFDTGQQTRKTIILGFIVVFHIALIWALNEGLRTQVVGRVFGPVETRIIEEIQQTEDEPPPPPPQIETPPPFVPPPDVVFDLPQATGPSTAITQVTARPTPAAPPPREVVRKAPEIDPRFRRRFQPEYPPTSRRLGEEGSVVLQVLVGPDGQVQEAKIQTSSGFARLDDAALKHALRAWRFTPGTEDGQAVTVWHSVRVTFKITG